MATFLFWMSPETGHILPTIKLANSLVERGHKCIYHTCGYIRSELAAIGLPSVESFREMLTGNVMRSLTRHTECAVTFEKVIQAQVGDTQHYYSYLRADLLRAIDETSPDVVLVDGIKDWRLWDGADKFYRHLCRRVRIGRLCVHLRKISPPEVQSHAPPLIILCPEEFEIPTLVQAGVTYAEASSFSGFNVEVDPSVFSKVSAHAVYVSLGSQAAHYTAGSNLITTICKVASLRPQWKFWVSDNHAPELRNCALDNVRKVPAMAQRQILRSASAMVSHGGLGSIKDCIETEVPMLVMPQLWDQGMNGRRVNHNKIGLSLDASQVTASSIIESLETLMFSDGIKINLARMAGVFKRYEVQQIGMNACERLLTR